MTDHNQRIDDPSLAVTMIAEIIHVLLMAASPTDAGTKAVLTAMLEKWSQTPDGSGRKLLAEMIKSELPR